MIEQGWKERNQRGKKKIQKKEQEKTEFKKLLMVLVIVFVFFGLELIVGWRSGVGAWMQEFQKPVVRQLDLSGISSPYAILIQAGSGKTVGDLNGEEQMYPASLTK